LRFCLILAGSRNRPDRVWTEEVTAFRAGLECQCDLDTANATIGVLQATLDAMRNDAEASTKAMQEEREQWLRNARV
jgi:hypothetical protein